MPLPVTLTVLFRALLAIAQQRPVQRPDGGQIPPSKIDATVKQLMEAAHVTGAGIAIFHGGHVSYLKTYGLRDVEKGLPLTIMTNSSNGEGIFKPLIDSVLGVTSFPFDWEGYTPYNLLPPLPKLKSHKRVSLTPAQLNRLVGRYALTPDVVLSVTVENGSVFIQENDGPKQEFLPESPEDFYSASSSDECSFKLADEGPARVMVLHLGGKDVELKRLP